MERLWRYYGNYQSFRGRVTGLPPWARAIILIAALPGIAAIALSILALLVSILALLLLTVPLYRLLSAITGSRTASAGGRFDGEMTETVMVSETADPVVEETPVRPGRRQIDVKIID